LGSYPHIPGAAAGVHAASGGGAERARWPPIGGAGIGKSCLLRQEFTMFWVFFFALLASMFGGLVGFG
jgi:hypothetical protein